MHVCEDFREKITEFILDHRDVAAATDLQAELAACGECAEFYAESSRLIDALGAVQFDIPEERWDDMGERMRAAVIAEAAKAQVTSFPASRWTLGTRASSMRALAAMAAMLVLTAGLYRLPLPLNESSQPVSMASLDPAIHPDTALDPVTIQFLEQSELLLRDVMKLQPANADDLDDARKVAGEQLSAIPQREEAASNVQPVVSVMNKYETILRDIHNLGGQPAAEDISDIKNRIEKNGLIANMKAFQQIGAYDFSK